MSYLGKILHGCREASLLAQRSREERLPFLKQLQSRMHLLICSSCRNFAKQAARIDKALHRLFSDAESPVQTNAEFRAKLKERLK